MLLMAIVMIKDEHKSLVKAIISYQGFIVISHALCRDPQNTFKLWESSSHNIVCALLPQPSLFLVYVLTFAHAVF